MGISVLENGSKTLVNGIHFFFVVDSSKSQWTGIRIGEFFIYPSLHQHKDKNRFGWIQFETRPLEFCRTEMPLLASPRCIARHRSSKKRKHLHKTWMSMNKFLYFLYQKFAVTQFGPKHFKHICEKTLTVVSPCAVMWMRNLFMRLARTLHISSTFSIFRFHLLCIARQQ